VRFLYLYYYYYYYYKCQDLSDANHKKLRRYLTQINKLKQKHVFKFSSPPAERTVAELLVITALKYIHLAYTGDVYSRDYPSLPTDNI